VIECVLNLSEGRNLNLLDELRATAGESFRDLHADEFHNRSVFTLIHDAEILSRDVRALITGSFEVLDLTYHEGVHPRFGVVDVVPFVALTPESPTRAIALRDETAEWISDTFDVPTYLYGVVGNATRSLPEIRKHAFTNLGPDFGPSAPSPTLGAVAVGARSILVAWNMWLARVSRDDTRALAKAIRRSEVRSLAFRVGDDTQVSCNLIDPLVVGPSMVYDEVASRLPPQGEIVRCELVGLLPLSVLETQDRARWGQLGLGEDLTIESRL
jgi:glutamate formiminotransferase